MKGTSTLLDKIPTLTVTEANKKHIKDDSLYYIEDSGHFPMLEQPDQFNETLMKTIKSVK